MLRKVFGLAAVLLFASLSVSQAATGAPERFSAPPVDQILDLHGNPNGAQLVIFMAGNQFMVMPPLLAAFRRRHPEIRKIFYETLPPGIVARQLAAGSLQIGNFIVEVQPDVFMAGRRRMTALAQSGMLSGSEVPYASNTLAIMIRKGNPKHIASLRDLGRPDVRVAMPNPRWEGVEEQIAAAIRKVGGTGLLDAVMRRKVAAGTTVLTRIHHRQTPLFIRENSIDAGPVWITEALYQQRIGAPVGLIRIPPADNVKAVSLAAALRSAPHRRAAQAFLDFLKTSQAREIYKAYGFGPPR